MYYSCNDCSPSFNRCTFIRNTASSGGAIYGWSGNGNPVFVECLIAENIAVSAGGAMVMSSGILTNCTIINNRAYDGSALFVSAA